MTKEKFQSYLEVQYSGATNMLDVRAVGVLSGGELSKADCLDIMQNYDEYLKQWPEVEAGM